LINLVLLNKKYIIEKDIKEIALQGRLITFLSYFQRLIRGKMIDLKKIQPQLEALIQPLLAVHELRIYELNCYQNSDSEDVLQVLIEFKQGNKPLDFDLLVQINEAISAGLDTLDNQFIEPYLLEVASAGIEKPIRNETELNQAVNDYVYLELNNPQKGITKTYATFLGFDQTNKKYVFSYFIKGKPQKLDLEFAQIKFIRHAVKF